MFTDINKPLKPAFAYVRFSSSQQREESLDAQKRYIKIYAKHEGYYIIRFYEDRAKSAKSTAKRTEFLEMMKDIETTNIEAVIVHKLDRFARNRLDAIQNEEILKDHDIQLISVMEQLENSPQGNLMKNIITIFNEYFVDNLSTETLKGLKENAHQCLSTGAMPLGYDADTDKKYAINEHEAEAVRLAFKMYDEGHKYSKIVEELNNLGYTTKRGAKFTTNSIYDMYKNPKYKGTYIYNQVGHRYSNGSVRLKPKPESEVIRYNGGVPAIVSTELWERVNSKMVTNKRTSGAKKAKHLYLLSGLIYCGECEHIMHGNARKPESKRDEVVSYRCSNRKNKAVCGNHEIKQQNIEDFVLAQLERYFFNDDIIPKLTAELNKYVVDTNSEYRRRTEKLLARQKEFEKKQQNIVEAITNTGYKEIFNSQLADIDKELRAISEQLNSSDICGANVTITETTLRGYVKQFQKFVRQRDIPQIKTFIDSYIERVDVYKEYVSIVFKIPVVSADDTKSDVNKVYNFSVKASRRQLK